MKITLYTITDCEFSKQEKEYLTTNKLTFEEKNLETNKEFLTEMLAVSNNFAGTPVTKIEKDDGQIVILKGFTKDEFDKALGLAPQEKKEEPPKEGAPATKTEPETAVPPPPPVEPVTQPADTQPTAPQQPAPANDLSAEASAKADPLNSILNDLQAKSGTPSTPTVSLNPTDTTPSAPTVPDFPAKT